MGDELQQVCGDQLRVIHINRPLERSIESLKERSRKENGWLRVTDEQAKAVQRWLWDRKLEWLRSVEHLTVDFDDLLNNPCVLIDSIANRLGITPTAEQFERAVAHVRTTA